MSATVALQPNVRVGEYALVRLLGAGGMGDVWLATDTRADRPVALKFIKPHLLADPGFRGRFLNEARTLGRLEHDRIVTLYNVVEDAGHLALVLRFIDGRSLAERIDHEGALPLDAVMACARDILPALGFAHERGTVHRDIKSQNVLVDRQGRCFLTDFGIAVGDLAPRTTVAGIAIGTPHYMSPEQIQTPHVLSTAGGCRSDIYSFGIVLFEMLTGKLPFGGDSTPEETYRVQNAHCVEPPPSLRGINPAVRHEVEAVVLRCLAKNPDERPQSCEELLRLLEAAAAGTTMAPAIKPRPQRAATIVESAPPVREEQAAPARKPPPPRTRSVPKSAWLSAAAVTIVVAIGLAVTGGEDPPPAAREERPVEPVAAGSAAEPAAPPAAQTPPVETTGGIPRPQQSPPAVTPTPAPRPPAVNPRAQQLFREAQGLFRQGEYCSGKERIDEALEIDPQNREYLKLQRDLTMGCNGIQ